MNTKNTPKLLTRMVIGLVIILLFSMGTPAIRSTSVNAIPLDRKKDLAASSKIQVNHSIEFDEKLTQFEGILAEMQQELAIPGMSAAIVKDQQLVWARGFGYADVEAKRLATVDTPYEIASLTKTLSATILLQLVEQGRVNLDDPVSKYGIHIKGSGDIRVKHLLGMTSLGEPGGVFMYSGDRYGLLQKVMERASGQSFPSLMIENILNPLGMNDSIPIDRIKQSAYTHIQKNLSKPYGMNQTYIESFNTAGGLISTVTDLAKFDIALDQNQLITSETKELAWTAQTLTSGDPPVYGLGCFVREFDGTKMVWAFGYDAFTHLYLKFVDQGYTLIIFTNSTTFGKYISMRDPNVMRYPAALAFHKLFIRDMALDDPVDWDANKEIIADQLQASRESGTTEIARQEIHDHYLTDWILENKAAAQETLATYTQYFTASKPPTITSQTPFAKIDQVGNDTYSILEFTLAKDTKVAIYAVGEYWLGKMVDYGGIEDVSSGELIWVMAPERTSPAGGNAINRQVTDQIELRAGMYRLHYRTDWDHSFSNWHALPPDHLFWGIALYPVGDQVSVVTKTVVPTTKYELLAGLLPLAGTSLISKWEYVILWTCLGVLCSVLIIVPVLLYRKKRSVETRKKVQLWTKVAGWVAWINSILCPLLVLVMMMAFGLEYIVENPIVLTSNMPVPARVIVEASYLCIALTIVQVIITFLAWKGQQRSLAERLYYSLATVTAAGYLVLLSTWGMIAAL